MNSTTAPTTPINPDMVHGSHTCDTAVLNGTPRREAEDACTACPTRRPEVPAQRSEQSA